MSKFIANEQALNGEYQLKNSQWDSFNANEYEPREPQGELLSLRAGFSISTRVLANAYVCVCVYF